jgi:adenylate cyclase
MMQAPPQLIKGSSRVDTTEPQVHDGSMKDVQDHGQGEESRDQEHQDHDAQIAQVWRTYLTTGRSPKGVKQAWFEKPIFRPVARMLPRDPRCRVCAYPFEGIGGALVRGLLGLQRSRLNPQMCNVCERFARKHQGGTEMEVSLLFADVRGSTSLAENMSAQEFSRLIDRFYRAATRVLFHHGAMVEKLIGDEVTGFFVPAFAGRNHARTAVTAGRGILQATGHAEQGGPWIPVGVGVHTGTAYIGTVGGHAEGVDIAVLGDNVNVAARLAAEAALGELLITEETRAAAELDGSRMEPRQLTLKGKEKPVDCWVITAVPRP